MVNLVEGDKLIKISEKEDKSNTYNRFSSNISFFIYRTSSDKTFLAFFYILANKEKIYKLIEVVKRYKGSLTLNCIRF